MEDKHHAEVSQNYKALVKLGHQGMIASPHFANRESKPF